MHDAVVWSNRAAWLEERFDYAMRCKPLGDAGKIRAYLATFATCPMTFRTLSLFAVEEEFATCFGVSSLVEPQPW